MRLSLKIILLAALLSACVFAGPFTSNPKAVDYYSSFNKDLIRIVQGPAQFFVGYVGNLIDKFAVGLFVVVLATAGWEAVTHQSVLNIDYIVRKFYLPYGFAVYILAHWFTPIPGLGVSFINIFTDAAAELQAHIDLSTLDLLETKFEIMRTAMGGVPDWTAGTVFFTYIGIFAGMILVKAVIFVITAFGYVALGVGACIGPIFVVLYLFPPLRHLWFSWVNYMIKYSLYQVVGSIVVAVWASAIYNYIENTLAGDYDLAHLASHSVSMIAIMLAFAISVFKVPSLVGDVTSGSSGSGHGMAGAIGGVVRGAFL